MRVLLFVISLFSFSGLYAQSLKTGVPMGRLMPAASEVRLLLIPENGDSYYMYNNVKQYDVYKDASGNGNFKKIATLTFPTSFAAFRKRVGNEIANEVKQTLEVASDEEAYRLLKEGKTNQFGFLFLSDNFMEGIGIFWNDKEVKQNNPKTTYKVTALNQGGTETTLFSQSIAEVQRLPFPEFRLRSLQTGDSSVQAVWAAPSRGLSPALWVKVYRKYDQEKDFSQLPDAAFISQNEAGDSLIVRYDEMVDPNHLFGYYIVPEDIAGNTGDPSDTASLISKSFRSLSGIRDFTAKDSMEGVWLSWKSLPNQSVYTGIEILKSRTPVEGYVVADTVAANADSYFDRNILPNVLYYYKARPLTLAIAGWDMVAPATTSISVSNKESIPLPPQGLKVWQDSISGNVQLAWEVNPETDQFAYYVLRGTSRENMTIISAPVKDNIYIDSIQFLAGGQTYLYGVQLMNLAQRMSPMSAVRMIKPYKTTYVPYPSGISSHFADNTVQLEWENVISLQEDVIGYRLYKREKGKTDFVRIGESLMGTPGYKDANVPQSAAYEYGVTAVNASGTESLMSPLTSITIPHLTLLPPADLYLTNKPEGIVVGWPSEQGTVASVAVYRREVEEQNFGKLGEVNNANEYIDKTTQKGKLYVYMIRTKSGTLESDEGAEKSIRRR